MNRQMNRRTFLNGLFASAGAAALTAAPDLATPAHAIGWWPRRVRHSFRHKPGTVVVDTRNRYLYLIENRRYARRYRIGVGEQGRAFTGTGVVGRKAKWPRWTPTASMIKRDPDKYARFAGGVRGGRRNPLGSRALYLYRNGRDTLYRIHGTNSPRTVGRAVSNGCIRMYNSNVADLYRRVPVGTRVVVI